MISKIIKIKGFLSLIIITAFCMSTMGAVVSDNDGSAFITKAEFDSLKHDFQAQIDRYNVSIDNKIDGAIAGYLEGIKISQVTKKDLITAEIKRLEWYSFPQWVLQCWDDDYATRTTSKAETWTSNNPSAILSIKPYKWWGQSIANYPDVRKYGVASSAYIGTYGYLSGGISFHANLLIGYGRSVSNRSNDDTFWSTNWIGNVATDYVFSQTGLPLLLDSSQLEKYKEIYGIVDNIGNVSNVLEAWDVGRCIVISGHDGLKDSDLVTLTGQYTWVPPVVSDGGFRVQTPGQSDLFNISYNMGVWSYSYSGGSNTWVSRSRDAWGSKKISYVFEIASKNIKFFHSFSNENSGRSRSYASSMYVHPGYWGSDNSRRGSEIRFKMFARPIGTYKVGCWSNEGASILSGSNYGYGSSRSLLNFSFVRSYVLWYDSVRPTRRTSYISGSYNNIPLSLPWSPDVSLKVNIPYWYASGTLSKFRNYTMAAAGYDIGFGDGAPLFSAGNDEGVLSMKIVTKYYQHSFSYSYAYVYVKHSLYNSSCLLNLHIGKFGDVEGNGSTLKLCDSAGNELGSYAQNIHPDEGLTTFNINIRVKKEDVVYIKLDPNEDTGLDYAQIVSATAKLTSE